MDEFFKRLEKYSKHFKTVDAPDISIDSEAELAAEKKSRKEYEARRSKMCTFRFGAKQNRK